MLRLQRSIKEHCPFFCLYAGTAAGMVRAPMNVSHLQFVTHIRKLNLSRNHNEFLEVWGLCALSNDVLLLACGSLGLRAYSMNSSQLSPHEIVAIGDVRGVAFDPRTDTLLLLVPESTTEKWQLVSLRGNPSNWLELMRVTIDMNVTNPYRPIIAVCNSHVLVVKLLQGDRLYVYNVSAEHSVRSAGIVPLKQPNWSGLACKSIGDDTYVALSHYVTSLVTLHRLVWPSPTRPSLDPLANNTIHNPYWLLFLDDVLLVCSWNSTILSDAIVSIRASDGALSEKRVLLTAAAEPRIASLAWTLARNRLVISDLHSGDLLIYSFV